MSVDALVAQVSDLAAQVSRLKQRQNADFTGQVEQITRIVSGPVSYLKSAVVLADDPAAGDWTTLDVSDYVPAGATHALLQLSFRGNDDGGEVRFRADAESIELNGVFAGITGTGEDLHMKLPPAAYPLSGSSRTFQYCVVEALQALTIQLVGSF